MDYIVCKKPGKFVLGNKNAPQRLPGHALLKIKKVGICGTDLHAYQGNQAFFTYPRILGHELAAAIIEVDRNDRNLKPGDKVVIMPYLSCNECVACKAGKTNCCANIQVLGIHTDGGMQEKITLPLDVLIPAKDLSYNEMAIVEPLAIGAHALKRAQLRPGETIVVVGCGPIGIGLMVLAKLKGARVIAMDINQKRLDYITQNLGMDQVTLANEAAEDFVREVTHGDMAAVVFDATGHKGALERGHCYMAHGGRYVLVGLSKGKLSFEHPQIHAKETTLLCSRNATLDDFEYVISVLEKKQFPIQAFVTHSVGYLDMIANFDHWTRPENGVIKAVVDF